MSKEKYNLNNFNDEEFACKCGCGLNEMNLVFVKKLDHARFEQGKKWVMNSAQRCRKHNLAVGGSPTSTHLKGMAGDVQCENAIDRKWKVYFGTQAGIRRTVLYDDKMIVHFDDDPKKPEGLFVYKKEKENA